MLSEVHDPLVNLEKCSLHELIEVLQKFATGHRYFLAFAKTHRPIVSLPGTDAHKCRGSLKSSMGSITQIYSSIQGEQQEYQ